MCVDGDASGAELRGRGDGRLMAGWPFNAEQNSAWIRAEMFSVFEKTDGKLLAGIAWICCPHRDDFELNVALFAVWLSVCAQSIKK